MISTVHRIGLFKIIIFTLLMTFSLLEADTVVNLKGTMSVEQGALNYKVDLQLPPGIAGVEPKLSLAYSSNSGNGTLGQGWSLSGLSAISRCGSTRVDDGKDRPVLLNDEDHYCLDGQRLVPIRKDSNEFRTKIESFSKIVAMGDLGNPTSFKVWTKSGDIYEYGSNDSSKFIHTGKNKTVSWKVSKITDALETDNEIIFTYEADATRIQSISYAKTINTVRFNYGPRKDIIKKNLLGQVITQDQKLDSIDILVNETTQRQYQLNYLEQQKPHDQLKLSSITECIDDQCLNPLSFEWEMKDQEVLLFTHQATNYKTDKSYKMQVADFNGDGYSDFLRLHEDNGAVFINDQNGGFVKQAPFWISASIVEAKLADIDNDGDIDIYESYSGADRIWLNDGTGAFTLSPERPYIKTDAKNILLMDVDRDGDMDIYQSGIDGNKEKEIIWLNDGSGAFTSMPTLTINRLYIENPAFGTPQWVVSREREQGEVLFYDIDGDGIEELFMVIQLKTEYPLAIQKNYMINVYKLESGRYVLSQENITHQDLSIEGSRLGKVKSFDKILDLNGDGIPDFLHIVENAITLLSESEGQTDTSAVHISNGEGQWITQKLDISANDNNKIKVIDINTDGASDIVYIDNDGHDKVWLNDGKGYFSLQAEELHLNGSFKDNDLLDINGDGAIDIVGKKSKTTIETSGSNLGGYEFDLVRVGENIRLNSGIGEFTAYANPIEFSYTDEHYNALYGDFNGDGLLDIFDTKKGFFLNEQKKEMIISIADSFNNKTDITYKPLSDSDIYTKSTDILKDVFNVQPAAMVVASTSTGNGLGGEYTIRYHYKGLKQHRFRGSLGFESITETDGTKHTKTVTKHYQAYPLTGKVWSIYSTVNGEPLNERVIKVVTEEPSPENEKVKAMSSPSGTYTTSLAPMSKFVSPTTDRVNYYIKTVSESEKKYINGQLIKEVNTVYDEHDDYGNVGEIIVTTKDGEGNIVNTKTTSSTYNDDENSWMLGRLVSTTVTHKGTDEKLITRKSEFTYYPNGMLESETIEPLSSNELTKTYTYDIYGNKVSETLSSPSFDTEEEDRTTIYTYEDNYQFIESVTNALKHTETREYDQATGKLLSVTGPNGFTTTWIYNDWGQKEKEIRADGTWTEWDYMFDGSINNSYYAITQTEKGGKRGTVYYDSLDRTVATKSTGFKDKEIFIETIYNNKGEVAKKSSPYKSGEDKRYIEYTYDDYGRIIQTKSPAPSNCDDEFVSTTVDYDGYTVTTTDAEGRIKRVKKNALDQVIKIEEGETADGNIESKPTSIEYTYDAVGNLLDTIPNEDIAHKITMNYDPTGTYKESMIDPNMGTWHYTYYADGKLKSQTDAKGQTTTIHYDELGRVFKKETPEGTNTWIYDSGTKAKGKLSEERRYDGFVKRYTYNEENGKLQSTTTHIDHMVYPETYIYNSNGQLEKVIKPDNLELIYTYNANGYMEAIKSPAPALMKDANIEHYTNLINDLLNSALQYDKKYYEYQAEANRLTALAKSYQAIAESSLAESQELLDIAVELKSYAAQYEALALDNQALANDAREQAAYYENKADFYKIFSFYGVTSADEYQALADEYTQTAAGYEQTAQSYLTKSTQYLYEAEMNNANAIVYAELAEENMDLAAEALQEVKALETQMMYYKRLAEENKSRINTAYQEILDDSDYIYHYKVLDMDSYGRVTQYLSGNGLINTDTYEDSGAMLTSHTGFYGDNAIRDLSYEYDKTYNVTKRTDTHLGVTSHYVYDALSRIENANFVFENEEQITGLDSTNYSYDAFGNIEIKSDIGQYNYSKTHPNRLMNVTSLETDEIVKTFEYDVSGNMIYNDGIIIEYNSANKATMINDNGTVIRFAYDMNENRYKKTQGLKVTHYVGKSFEYTENGDGSITQRHLIYANGKVVAINTDTYAENSNEPLSHSRYLHYDALGSVDTITDDRGVVLERRAYKPFGEQLEVYKKEGTGFTTNRGYTGHEHIEGTRLIHMNARLYDPTLGRFLSADPIVQDPYDTQAFNRYSYVRNNPLKYTDPSGHSWFSKILKVIVVAVIAIVASYVVLTYMVPNSAGMGYLSLLDAAKKAEMIGTLIAAGAAGGFAGGVTSGLLNGASLGDSMLMGAKGAIFGGISAGIAYGIGHTIPIVKENDFLKAIAHGITRGAINVAQGGNFKSGFMSSFASKTLGGLNLGLKEGAEKLVFSTLVGGTASKISGGKFANGAVSAAVVYLFNDMTEADKDPEFQALMKQKNENVLRNEMQHNIYKQNALQTQKEFKQGTIAGLKAIDEASGPAALMCAYGGQVQGAVFFGAVGSFSKYLLYQLEDTSSQRVYTEMFVETGLDIAAQGDFRLEIMVEFAKGFYGEVLDEVYQ